MSQFAWDNCPAAVRDQIARLVSGFRAIAGDNLLGVYLHGSLALGCFNPLRSDLDILAVTHAALGADARRRLAAFLPDVSQQPYPVEVSLLLHGDLHPWRHPTPFDFHYSESWRAAYAAQLAGGDQTWTGQAHTDPDLAAHITVVRQRGVRLCGPPIPEVFPDVPRSDYLDSVHGDVLSDEFGLASADAPPVYALLNGCRTLAYLVCGQIRSKDEGGEWAQRHLPPAYHAAVEQALFAYRNLAGDEGMDSAAALALAKYLRSRITAHFSDENPATNILG